MKINYLKMSAFAVIAASTLFLGSCSKDEDTKDNPGGGGNAVENYDQNSVIFSFTGNWCGPCGANGKPAITKVYNAKKDRTIVLSCQLNGGSKDPLNSQEANILAGAFGIQSIPTIYVAGFELPMTQIPVNSSAETNIIAKVDELIGNKPTVFPIIKKSINGSTMTVNVETKFLKEVSGEYYISAFVLEDKIAGNQFIGGVGWDTNAEFSNVVRKGLEIGSNGFGQLVTSGSVTVGQSFKKDYTVTLDPTWKAENIKVAVVISKKTDGKFTVSNGAVK